MEEKKPKSISIIKAQELPPSVKEEHKLKDDELVEVRVENPSGVKIIPFKKGECPLDRMEQAFKKEGLL